MEITIARFTVRNNGLGIAFMLAVIQYASECDVKLDIQPGITQNFWTTKFEAKVTGRLDDMVLFQRALENFKERTEG